MNKNHDNNVKKNVIAGKEWEKEEEEEEEEEEENKQPRNNKQK